jgi:gliding motility-associated-like protein
MKKIIFLFFLFIVAAPAYANHLKGGFFTYEYLGPGTSDPSHLKYRVRLTVYMICNPNSGQIDQSIPFTFFNNNTNQIHTNITVSLTGQYTLSKLKDEECITGNQAECYYTILTYELSEIELPPTGAGYTVSYQRCCRITGIQNVAPPSNALGNTYSIRIPGTATPLNASTNRSAVFLVNDTAVVCGGSFFKIPFIATDPDSDSLSYSFCGAWRGGGQGGGTGPDGVSPNPAAAPPYNEIPYSSGFTGQTPLGNNVSINPATGLISGIAPPTPGEYVVTVCVNEWRNGTLIASTRKELHLRIGDCNSIQANISINNQIIQPTEPQYINCKTFNLNFANPTTSGIISYSWDFGIAGRDDDTSNLATPIFLFPDTGSYNVTLVVNRGQACSDSTTAIVKLYPGFFAGFTFDGICTNLPTRFTDTTRTVYGSVSAWNWNFGNSQDPNNTSTIRNPSHTYTTTGTKNVQMIVRSSLGCVDTVSKAIQILDKPPLSVAFKDTLICAGDTLRLQATGTGNMTWTPDANITGANTSNPLVFPATSTNYFVRLDQGGCINNDTVKVNVVNFVTLQVRSDTTICLTDSVRLIATGNGLSYTWSPNATIGNPNIQNPMARPQQPTRYTVISRIGKCSASGSMLVTPIPYPVANAGADTTICFDSFAQLRGSMQASSFSWSNASSLTNANTLTPIARPPTTTRYILTVFDNLGCPKPVRDTVLVTVLPKIFPFAGNDTSVVAGQPLQFNAMGGIDYLWTPATGLSSNNIVNPVGMYNGSFDSIRYRVYVYDEAGCVDSSFITVKIFKTEPQVFVPSAFTPNKDGKNDLFRPIAVGLTKIEYFRVFNRWGQLVFSTTINGHGWDGKINGMEQGTGTFVWLVKGVDYTGKSVFHKGTVTLIR